MNDEVDPALFEVLASCKVFTRKGQASCSTYTWVEARPEGTPPEIMTQDPCWQGDHWRFSNDLPSSVLSVYDTWVFTGVDTWQDGTVCVLELQRRGFLFQKWDPTGLEAGAGI